MRLLESNSDQSHAEFVLQPNLVGHPNKKAFIAFSCATGEIKGSSGNPVGQDHGTDRSSLPQWKRMVTR